MAVFRELVLPDDAEAVIQFYDRHGFGFAHAAGFPLTAAAFQEMMRENGLLHYDLIEDGGQIVGVNGFFPIDAAMAARPYEIRNNHFLMAATARGGMLTGRAFEQAFAWLVDHGVRLTSLRVRPQNKVALSAYLRAGFRAVEHSRPAGDGFLDLTSVLPGVLGAAQAVTADPELGIELPNINWVHLKSDKGVRGSGFDDGVERLPDGRVAVSYQVAPRGMVSQFTVDAANGRIRRISLDGVDYTDLFEKVMNYQPDPPPVSIDLPGFELGSYTVYIDSDGGLIVDHVDHLGPVLVDCFPDHLGLLAAYRLPPRRLVETRERPDGWATRDASGTVRLVKVTEQGLEICCRLPVGTTAPGRLAVRPWVGLRTGAYSVAAPGEATRTGYLQTGLWPPLLPGYEACGDADWSVPLDGAQQAWTDPDGGLGVRIDWRGAGRLRCEGQARAAGPVLRYRVRLLQRRPRLELTAALPQPGRPGPAWSGGGRGQRRLASADGAGQVVLSSAGLLSWTALDQVVWPDATSKKPFHCLSHLPATLWPSLDSDRTDVARGPEWAEADHRVVFTTTDGSDDPGDPTQARWSLRGNADLTELELTTVAGPEWAGLDFSLNLRPPPELERVELLDGRGSWITLEATDATARPTGLWWSFTRWLRFDLPAGRVTIAPVAGEHPEILVRAPAAGFLFALQSRVRDDGPSVSRWRVTLTPWADQD
ncbi:MAG: GNAT family N-acetyltransferase [Propionibacteriaceae bacterium]|nr:GNAT family N-acetyltransferase [Propionibacteriaceae bacterium]